jgi:L-fuconolactonase
MADDSTDQRPRDPIIDAHLHFWDPARVELPWLRPEHAPIARAFMPREIEPARAAAGVERAVVVQTAGSDADTELLRELGAAHDWIAALVVWVPLDEPDRCGARLDELESDSKVRGVRHHSSCPSSGRGTSTTCRAWQRRSPGCRS